MNLMFIINVIIFAMMSLYVLLTARLMRRLIERIEEIEAPCKDVMLRMLYLENEMTSLHIKVSKVSKVSKERK